MRGSASSFMRPCVSTATFTTRFRPSPTTPSALNSVACASAPVMTVIGGAPNSPSASTFQPTFANTACRAADSAVMCATVVPVTKPPATPVGSCSTATSHLSATSSRIATPGLDLYNPAFWSHAVASQPAATLAGVAPPITNPKNRGPAMAIVAGDPRSSSFASIARASIPVSGNGTSNAPSAATASALGDTRRSDRPSRYVMERAAASRSRSDMS